MAKSGLILKTRIDAEATMLRVNKKVARKMSTVMTKHVKKRDTLVNTWSAKNQPDFTKEQPEITSGSVVSKVKLSASEARMARISVYELLDDGTKVRHVRMTSDFKPKTTVRGTTSGVGAGDVIRNSLGEPMIFLNAAPEGIEARHFDDTINELLEPDMRKAIKDALTEAFRQGVVVRRVR